MTDALGSAVAPVALALALLDLTGSVTALGLVVGAQSAARVLLLLFGGVAADRLPRHLVLTGSNILAALAQGLLAVAVLRGVDDLGVLTALAVATGATGAFSLPAASALVPETVPAADRQPANALAGSGSRRAPSPAPPPACSSRLSAPDGACSWTLSRTCSPQAATPG